VLGNKFRVTDFLLLEGAIKLHSQERISTIVTDGLYVQLNLEKGPEGGNLSEPKINTPIIL